MDGRTAMTNRDAEAVCEALTRLRQAGTMAESYAAWRTLIEAHDTWKVWSAKYTIRWRGPSGRCGGYEVALDRDMVEQQMLSLRAMWPKFEFWSEPL